MTGAEARLLKSLLTEIRVLSLAVIAEGVPVTGLLPFVARPDLAGVIIHASRLARHARGLFSGAPCAYLVHAEDHPDGDPLQVPRLSVEGVVRTLARDSSEYEEARALYQARLPSSAATFELGDFELHELRFLRGRFVTGFGRAMNLSQVNLREAAGAETPAGEPHSG